MSPGAEVAERLRAREQQLVSAAPQAAGDRRASLYDDATLLHDAHAEIERLLERLEAAERGQGVRRDQAAYWSDRAQTAEARVAVLEQELATARQDLGAEGRRKIAAYDAARGVVVIEGNTRAFYVLRAEAAEAREATLREALRQIAEFDRDEWQNNQGFVAAGFLAGRARRALAVDGTPDSQTDTGDDAERRPSAERPACECGHSALWHTRGGEGHCERGHFCKCGKFEAGAFVSESEET